MQIGSYYFKEAVFNRLDGIKKPGKMDSGLEIAIGRSGTKRGRVFGFEILYPLIH
jgi:hypothetical protein